jgi:hypothetical protein
MWYPLLYTYLRKTREVLLVHQSARLQLHESLQRIHPLDVRIEHGGRLYVTPQVFKSLVVGVTQSTKSDKEIRRQQLVMDTYCTENLLR